MSSPVRLEDSLVLEIQKRVDSIRALQVGIAPLAAIPAARSAPRHGLLPAECGASVAAIAGDDANPGPINEHGSLEKRRTPCGGPCLEVGNRAENLCQM